MNDWLGIVSRPARVLLKIDFLHAFDFIAPILLATSQLHPAYVTEDYILLFLVFG